MFAMGIVLGVCLTHLYIECEDDIYSFFNKQETITPFNIYDNNYNFAPSDKINRSQMSIINNTLMIKNLPNETWISSIAGTGSMRPTMHKDHHTIQTNPRSPDNIKVGDIITYRKNESLVIHRVIGVGIDDEGWYAILKGDGNEVEDKLKVRFGMVESKTIMLIY